MGEELYWNIKKPLSYNCLWNFILSMRGGGKTYGSLDYCIEQHLKAKKKGIKCIGCPDGAKCSGNCTGCSGNCCGKNK